MVDLSKTIEAKADHLTADDLINHSRTITIKSVSANGGERPVTIDYYGGEGKPYLPCKTMRRVLAAVWGTESDKYIGQKITLYRDDTVKFGGQAVGGIRISHITGLDKPLNLSLAVARGRKNVFTVNPLIDENMKTIEEIEVEISSASELDDLKKIYMAYKNHAEIESIKVACASRKHFLLQEIQEGESLDGKS